MFSFYIYNIRMKFRPLHVMIALVVALMFCCVLQLECCPGFLREGFAGESENALIENQSAAAVAYNTSDTPSTSFPSVSGPSVAAAQPSYSQMVTGPQGQAILATPHNTVMGIPQNMIPAGQENLYVLKSEIVPPVCPACPSGSVCPREKPCPPCPACARCPEPAFECKKVPNYTTSRQAFPVPVLNDFSTFGM